MGLKLNISDRLHGTSGWFKLEVELIVDSPSLIGIYGDSGSGKTTLLRSIAGLHQPKQVLLALNDEVLSDSSAKTRFSHRERNISMVFQENALYPHMSVEENIKFALGKDNENSINEIVSSLGIEGIRKRKPTALSGGQQQRVALARALVNEPEILLLDEPLSALDKQGRSELQELIALHHKRIEAYTFLVSHDLEELEKLSDMIFELKDGKLSSHTSPKNKDWKIVTVEESNEGIIAVLENNGRQIRLKQ